MECSSILPCWPTGCLLKAGDPQTSAHPSRGQATRCQDSWDPVLCVPTSLCSLYKWEHLPWEA